MDKGHLGCPPCNKFAYCTAPISRVDHLRKLLLTTVYMNINVRKISTKHVYSPFIYLSPRTFPFLLSELIFREKVYRGKGFEILPKSTMGNSMPRCYGGWIVKSGRNMSAIRVLQGGRQSTKLLTFQAKSPAPKSECVCVSRRLLRRSVLL